MWRYQVANQALEENKRESRQLSDVLDASLLTLPSNCRQPLDFFLILPVQRLMRYKLLLQRIVSLCDGVHAQVNLLYIPLKPTICQCQGVGSMLRYARYRVGCF